MAWHSYSANARHGYTCLTLHTALILPHKHLLALICQGHVHAPMAVVLAHSSSHMHCPMLSSTFYCTMKIYMAKCSPVAPTPHEGLLHVLLQLLTSLSLPGQLLVGLKQLPPACSRAAKSNQALSQTQYTGFPCPWHSVVVSQPCMNIQLR